MIQNKYQEFCDAVNNIDIGKVEDIFSYSDMRGSLVSRYIQENNNDKNLLLNVSKAFKSRGLKEQIEVLCEECKVDNCKIKMFTNRESVHFISHENIEKNKKQGYEYA